MAQKGQAMSYSYYLRGGQLVFQNDRVANTTILITSPPASTSNGTGLSRGKIASIVICSLAVIVAILTFAVNPNEKIGDIPVWRYRRGIVYRCVGGCTFRFGCGTRCSLRTQMVAFVIKGGLW